MVRAAKRAEPVPVPACILAHEDKVAALRDRMDAVCREATGRTPFSKKYPFLSWGDTKEEVRVTIAELAYLRARRDGIAAALEAGVRGGPIWEYVYLKSDPTWLVDMALNRRAGWPDDPGHVFGSAMPVKRWDPGFMVCPIYQFPKHGSTDTTLPGIFHPQTIHTINTPRVVVRANQVPKRYRERLRKRLTWPEDEERW